MDDFRRMVGNNVTSYSTKMRLLDIIRSRLKRLEEAERKLIAREDLDSTLQALYDTLSADGLKDKLKATKAAVSDSKPAGLAPLKYAAEIQRLHKRLAGLAKLEKEAAGKYTLDQL